MENQLSHTILGGTDGDDYIVNYGAYVSIGVGAGDDSIVNYNGSYSTLEGGDGDDFIANEDDGDHVLIDGGAGIDTIHNTGNYSTVLGGDDGDSIHNQAANVLIDAGDGDNEVSNTNQGEHTTIIAGTGSDTIFNGGNLTAIQSGAGDDCILSGAASVSIDAGDDSDIVSLSATAFDVTVRAGDGEDTVINNGTNALIELGDGDDFFQNTVTASYVTVRGGNGADYFVNFGNYSRILGESGNDAIYNLGSNNFIDGGNDDDLILSYSNETIPTSNVTINGGRGNDTLQSESASSSIVGGAGDDSITNYGTGTNSTLEGGDGADTIKNSGAEALINGGNDDDFIVNYSGGTRALINGGAGGDLIYNYAIGSTVNGGAGDDGIFNTESGVVVDGGTGDDVVYSESLASGVTINGGSGSDLIHNLSSNGYIDGGNDDDAIYVMSLSADVTVRGGAGNDTLFVLGSNVYADGGGDDDVIRIENGASNTTLLGGAGNDVIYNRAATSSISGGTGTDHILNYASNVTISGDASTDVILNTASSVIADGGTGNDVLHNQGTAASNVTLNGGAANDSINNEAAFVSILGGDGNDKIISNSDDVTINAGTSNDLITVYGSRNVIQYANGDGTDTVFGFNATDTVSLTDYTMYNTLISGADFIVSLLSDSIVLKDAASIDVKIAGGYFDHWNETPNITLRGSTGNETINNAANNVTIEGLAGDDTIQNQGAYVKIEAGAGNDTVYNGSLSMHSSINGGAGNDTINNVASYTTIRGGTGDDYINGLSKYAVYQYAAGDGNDTIVLLDPTDTVSIVDDSRYTTLVSNNDVLVSLESGSIMLKNSSTKNINIRGGVRLFNASDDAEVFSFASLDGANIINGFAARDSISVSGGAISAHYARGDDYIVEIGGSARITLEGAAGFGFSTLNNMLIADRIESIPSSYVLRSNDTPKANIIGTAARDFITNSAEGVTVRGNEGDDILELSNNAELIIFAANHGHDSILGFGYNDSVQLVNSTFNGIATVGNDLVVNVAGTSSVGSITLKDAVDKNVTLNGAFLTVISDINFVNNSEPSIKVDGTSGRDYIINTAERVTIESGAGNDTIEGADAFGEMYLFASNTNDNTVTNFGLNDTLRCTAGSIVSYAVDGNDVLVSLKGAAYSGTVRLLNTATYRFKQSGSYLTVDGVNTISNTDADRAIDGTESRDYIVNSGERATIDGKGGNDTIEGSTHGEVFLFGATGGRDLITSFGVNDTLKIIQGSIQSRTAIGDDYVIDVRSAANSGAITLGGAGKYNFVENEGVLTVSIGGDYIINNENEQFLKGTNGADWIINSGSGVTIQGNGDDDTIEGSSYGEMILVASNHGNDVITNFGENDTLRCTAGKIASISTVGDDIFVSLKGAAFSGSVTLLDAAGLDVVQSGSYITVKPAPIPPTPPNTFVGGTTGNDVINVSNGGTGITIQGNEGDDTITGSDNGEMILVASNHGNDVITNFGANDTLRCTAGSIASFETVGNDVFVSLKGAAYSGSVTLKDAAGLNLVKSGKNITVEPTPVAPSNTLISGTSGDDVIDVSNGGTGLTISSGDGNDTLTGSDNGDLYLFASNTGNNVVKNFGADDTIRCTAGKIASFETVGNDVFVSLKGAAFSGSVTLKDAAGLNLVKSGSYITVKPFSNTLISGTSGDDVIDVSNGGTGLTISSGAGNDTLTGSDNGDLYLFASNTGNNVVKNFGADDTIRCTAGKINSIATVGSDVVVTLKGAAFSGSVTLKDAAGLNLVKSGSYITVKPFSNTLISGTSGDDVIDVSNGGTGLTISSGAGNDTITGSDNGDLYLFASNTGNNVVKNFGADDTIRCTAGKIQAVTKVGDDVVIDLKGSKYSGRVTLEGVGDLHGDMRWDKSVLTVDAVNYIINRKDKVKVVGTEGRDWIMSTGEKVSLQPGKGNDTVTGSDAFGDMFLLSSDAGDNIITNFNYNDTLKSTAGTITDWKRHGDDVIVTIQGKHYTGVETLLGAAGLDLKKSGNALVVENVKVISNSMDKNLVAGSSGKDRIINSGEFVTIQAGAGDDTVEGSDEYGEMYLFASNTGDNVVLNFRSNDTLKCTAGSIDKFATVGSDVVVTLKGSKFSGSVTLKDAAGLNFKQSGKNLMVDGGVNIISNDANARKVVGTDGADWIVNSGMNVSIQANAGNDTLEGSTFGEMYLFSSADGNNVITNFGVNDSLKMTAGQSLTFATVGADVVVTLKGAKYKGVETLKGAAGLNFKKSGSTLYVDVASKILNTTDRVKVIGTNGADYITNVGQGVTLQSGAGNDTIEGSDLYGERFLFSHIEGDNVIVNFGENDTLQMTAGDTMTGAVKGDDYVVTLKGKSGTGTVTLKDVGANNFAIKDNILRMWESTSTTTRAELAPSEDDYWFLDEETTAAPTDELDEMLLESYLDNAVGKLTTVEDTLDEMMSVSASPSIKEALEKRRQY